MKVLVLGASGLLGNAMMRVLSERREWEVFGTVRSEAVKEFFSPAIAGRLVAVRDVGEQDDLSGLFDRLRPDVVINCISLARKLLSARDPLLMIPIYALLPHRVSSLCGLRGARLVHISTDGVFSGQKGAYTEDDPADARDLYGICKILGEVREPHAITLRTSMVGHELRSADGLLGWFLAQQGRCKCYRRAIFSGLPTVVLAQIVRDIVLPRSDLSGVYHVAAQPISKYDLLRLVAEVYGKAIDIVADDTVAIDRSLNADRFRKATGYVPPDWRGLIEVMHSYQ